MTALFRHAKRGPTGDASVVTAALLLAALLLTMLVPTAVFMPELSRRILAATQTVAWLLALGFLMARAVPDADPASSSGLSSLVRATGS